MTSSTSSKRAIRTGKVALFILWASFAAIAFNLYATVEELALIDHVESVSEMAPDEAWPDSTIARVEANERRRAQAKTGYGLAVGLSWIALLVFVSRMNQACRDLGATDMRFTPRSWIYWVVPIVNLFRPYQIVRELWTTTDPDGKSSVLLGFWWAGWLLSGPGMSLAPRGSSESLDSMRAFDRFLVGVSVVEIVGFTLTIVVVSRLIKRIETYRERLAPTARVVTESSD